MGNTNAGGCMGRTSSEDYDMPVDAPLLLQCSVMSASLDGIIRLRVEHIRNPDSHFWLVDKSYEDFRELHVHLRMRYPVVGVRTTQ